MIRFSKMADYGVLLLGHMARSGTTCDSGTGGAETVAASSANGLSPSNGPTAVSTIGSTSGSSATVTAALTSASDLAEALHMPRSVVSNLLKSFREAGILESRRGLHGGYRMTQAPEDISLLAVLRAIDGPVQLTDCAAFELDLATNCEYEDVCNSRSPLLDVNRRIIEMLDGMTLAELQRAPDSPAATPTTPSAHD